MSHDDMLFSVKAVDFATYQAWLASQSGGAGPAVRRHEHDRASADHRPAPRSALLDWLTTTDHKKIGAIYIASAFGFALVRRS